MALIDADLFKSVNDTYGHQAGDAALRTIASVISSCVRSSDILIRYGGDEFLLLFPRIPKATFQLRLEQICKAVSAVSVPDYPELRLRRQAAGRGHPAGGPADVSQKSTAGAAMSRAGKALHDGFKGILRPNRRQL